MEDLSIAMGMGTGVDTPHFEVEGREGLRVVPACSHLGSRLPGNKVLLLKWAGFEKGKEEFCVGYFNACVEKM